MFGHVLIPHIYKVLNLTAFCCDLYSLCGDNPLPNVQIAKYIYVCICAKVEALSPCLVDLLKGVTHVCCISHPSLQYTAFSCLYTLMKHVVNSPLHTLVRIYWKITSHTLTGVYFLRYIIMKWIRVLCHSMFVHLFTLVIRLQW